MFAVGASGQEPCTISAVGCDQMSHGATRAGIVEKRACAAFTEISDGLGEMAWRLESSISAD